MSSQKKLPPISNNWLIIFGDLISLLLVFFILIYIVAPKREEWQQIARAFSKHFNPDSRPVFIVHKENQANSIISNGKNNIDIQYIYNIINDKIYDDPLFEKIAINLINNQIIIIPKLQFIKSEADLSEKSKKIIHELATIIDLFSKKVTISTLADRSQFENANFDTRFKLSTARGMTVKDYFVKTGFNSPIDLMVINVEKYNHENSIKIIINDN